MIGYLKGIVISKGIQSLLVNVQGVGYQVLVPLTVADQAILDHEVELFCHLAVREDALTLYGFASADDQTIFEQLISVSGVGPKIGLSVLSTYSPAEVQSAVATGNASAFSAVSGIGKKNADRIVLELKNKLATPAGLVGGTLTQGNELSAALISLGYSPAEVTQISQGIDAQLPIQQQIKLALAKLSR